MTARQFAASGKLLVEITDTTGDDADFGMSGTLSVPDYSSTAAVDLGRFWLDGDDVYEIVLSGLAPAPGQEVVLYGLPGYCQVVEGSFWITNGGSQSFSMPIPQHVPSGDAFAGTWTVRFDSNSFGVVIKASSDAYDFAQANYIVHGVVRFVNV